MTGPAEDTPRSGRGTWWSAVAALVLLTAITAVISYEHAYEVFWAAHNRGVLAALGPVVPDLVIAVASVSLIAASRAGFPRPRLATFTLAAFIGVTIALNVAAGLRYGRGSALLAVLAPCGYLVGLHILASMMRRGRGGDGAPAPAAPGSGPHCMHKIAQTADEAVRTAWEHERDCLGLEPTYVDVGARFGIDRRKVPAMVSPAPAVASSIRIHGAGAGAQDAAGAAPFPRRETAPAAMNGDRPT